MSQEQQMQAQMTGPDGQPNPNAPATQEWVVQQITGLAEQIAQAMKSQQEGTQQAVQQVMQSVSQEIQPIAEIIKKLTQQTMLNSQSISELSKAMSQIEQAVALPPQDATIDQAPNIQAGPGPADAMVPATGI